MSLRIRTPLHTLVAIPVALIVLGALALSVAAVVEELRFIRAADRTLELVSTVRTVAAGQKGFAPTAGEDVWADLEHIGQIFPDPGHPNPWGGEVRMTTAAMNVVGTMAMRIESDVPRHDCRRLALYFLGRQPADLGLLAIEAQPATDSKRWGAIYPLPAGYKSADLVEAACGQSSYSRLALTFRIR